MIILAIFKWIGIVLLAIILLIFLLSLIPIHVDVRYDQELTARLRILFYKKTLYPSMEEEEDLEDPEEDESLEEDPKGKKKSSQSMDSIKEIFDFLKENLDILKRSLKFLCRGIRVRNMEILWRIHGENAAETAQFYGYVEIGIGILFGIANELFRFKKYRIHVEPDFEEKGMLFRAKADISFRLITILLLFPKLVRIYFNYTKWKEKQTFQKKSFTNNEKVTEKS